MPDSRKFPFLDLTETKCLTDLMPYLPLTLERGGKSIDVLGLVDSGASINVLPYGIGVELGAIWEKQTTFIKLSGNLANYEASGLLWRLTGYLVGGTSPFGIKTKMLICAEKTIFDLERIYINGGKRGFLIRIKPRVLREILEIEVAVKD